MGNKEGKPRSDAEKKESKDKDKKEKKEKKEKEEKSPSPTEAVPGPSSFFVRPLLGTRISRIVSFDLFRPFCHRRERLSARSLAPFSVNGI